MDIFKIIEGINSTVPWKVPLPIRCVCSGLQGSVPVTVRTHYSAFRGKVHKSTNPEIGHILQDETFQPLCVVGVRNCTVY